MIHVLTCSNNKDKIFVEVQLVQIQKTEKDLLNMNFDKIMQMSKRYIQTVKPHTPLIRFRKGSIEGTKIENSQHEVSSTKPMSSRPVIEDYQLPLKYRRKLLDETEINAINSGGIY